MSVKSWVIGVSALLILLPQGAANASPAPAATPALAPNTGSVHFYEAGLTNFAMTPGDSLGTVVWRAASEELTAARNGPHIGDYVWGISLIMKGDYTFETDFSRPCYDPFWNEPEMGTAVMRTPWI